MPEINISEPVKIPEIQQKDKPELITPLKSRNSEKMIGSGGEILNNDNDKTQLKSVIVVQKDITNSFTENTVIKNDPEELLESISVSNDQKSKESNLSAGFAIIGKTDPESNQKVFYINGIQTSRQECLASGHALSEILDGQAVEVIFNPVKGLNAVRRTVLDKIDAGDDTEQVKHIAARFLEQLRPENGEGPEVIKVVAHSHGNLVLARSLSNVERSLQQEGRSQEEILGLMKKIIVVGVGSAASTDQFPTGVSITRISNPGDLVPKISSDNSGGRVEDMFYDIQRSNQEVSKNYTRLAKESTGGIISIAKLSADIVPKIVEGTAKSAALGIVSEARSFGRMVSRGFNAIKEICFGLSDIANKVVATGKTDSKFLFKDHTIMPSKYSPGYFGDYKHIASIRQAFSMEKTV